MNFGSLDSDVFTFDANTWRMSQYKFNVGSQSVTGNLSWNPNGSLATLGITDQLNASNSQTCNFTHDDLARIASANCGAPWSQTFSIDPFGNLKKTGTISFQPTYDATTNRFQTIPGGTPTYDLNGNLTYDLSHNYTWDAEGKALSIDTVNLTHDALGRMVEQNRSGSYTQIVYSPVGSKLALMSGQTLQKAFVPLPGGATAVYTGSGLAYYRHADWLRSSRLASTPGRAKYYDVAYGPYGESYAGSGTIDLNFTGQNQDTVSGMYDFPYREYHSVQGRWISPDPAGLGAVSASNPQTWNRYAYVGNSPCSYLDPLGLDRCNFNIGINNRANLSTDQLTAIEDQINAVLGATQTPEGDSVGVSLTLKGKADYTLKLSNSGSLGTLGVDTSFLWWHRTSVNINSIQAHFSGAPSSDLDRIAGTISAHELVHRIAGIGDLPFDPGSPNLMSIDYNPGFDNVLLSPGVPSGLQLTPGQVSDLFRRCRQKHPSGKGGGGHLGPYLYEVAGDGGGWAGLLWALGGGGTGAVTDDVGPGSGWCPACPLPPLEPRP